MSLQRASTHCSSWIPPAGTIFASQEQGPLGIRRPDVVKPLAVLLYAVVQTNETTRINGGSPCTWVAPCCSCSSAAVQPTTPWCHLKRNWYEWIFIGAKICKALNTFTLTTMFSNQDSKVFYRIPSPQLLGCSHLSRFCGEANCHLGHGHGSTGMAGSVAKWGLCSPVSPFVDAWLVGRGQEKGSSKPGSNGSIVVAIRQNLCALLIWTCWTIRTFEANVPSNSFRPASRIFYQYLPVASSLDQLGSAAYRLLPVSRGL